MDKKIEKLEIGENLMYVLNTLFVCVCLATLAWLIKDFNTEVFASGYTQIVQEGKVIWVKADSVIQK